MKLKSLVYFEVGLLLLGAAFLAGQLFFRISLDARTAGVALACVLLVLASAFGIIRRELRDLRKAITRDRQ